MYHIGLGAGVHCGRGLDTPLHAAVRVGGVKEVALLLEHGADGKCRNSEGKTPLDLATDNNIQHVLQTAGKTTHTKHSYSYYFIITVVANSKSILLKESKLSSVSHVVGPWSLSQLSRLCIRRSLGQKRLNRARVLQLPHILHTYIMYQ